MIEIRHRHTGEVLYAGSPLLLRTRNLRGADLRGADLAGIDLCLVDLREADLRGADLRGWGPGMAVGGTFLIGARLQGAFYDQTTRWPLLFNPARCGCVRAHTELTPAGPPEGAGRELAAAAQYAAPAVPRAVVALQREIRRAGWWTDCVRRLANATLCLLVCGVVYALTGNRVLVWLLFFAMGWLSAWRLVFGHPVAVWFRGIRNRRLRRQLAALSPEEQAAVLLPLKDEVSRDTREILEPLLRERGMTHEVAPASPPNGQGREVAPP